MKQYVVRNKIGSLVAVLGETILRRMLVNVNGYWHDYNANNSNATKCFEVTENCAYGLGSDDTLLRLYLWKGYTISEDI